MLSVFVFTASQEIRDPFYSENSEAKINYKQLLHLTPDNHWATINMVGFALIFTVKHLKQKSFTVESS